MGLAVGMALKMTVLIDRRGILVASMLLALLAAPSSGLAGGSRSLPPDVDLDPDRGMSFGRLPKTSFDRRVFDPMKRSLGSQAMDPSIDPYNPVARPSRYEPATGKIRDSLSDKLRDLRRNEEAARKARSEESRRSADAKQTSSSGSTKRRKSVSDSSSRPITPARGDD
jgi:hypothetical protein